MFDTSRLESEDEDLERRLDRSRHSAFNPLILRGFMCIGEILGVDLEHLILLAESSRRLTVNGHGASCWSLYGEIACYPILAQGEIFECLVQGDEKGQ